MLASKENIIQYWIKSKVITDKNLIKAFRAIKRELFVPKELEAEAYLDTPLPIGKEQTISQPTTVMIMLQALQLKKGQRVLEIGSSSGYNAAIIASLIKPGTAYTIEIIPELARLAEENLKKTKIKNARVICADGSKGYSETAPYDRIILTAGSPETPKQLLRQLKENGILLAPIGPFYAQKMLKIKKKKTGMQTEDLGDFVFVPLKGKYG